LGPAGRLLLLLREPGLLLKLAELGLLEERVDRARLPGCEKGRRERGRRLGSRSWERKPTRSELLLEPELLEAVGRRLQLLQRR
jgi:hypothetical protein